KAEKVVERVEVPVIGDEQIVRLEQAARALSEVGTQLVATAQEIAAALAKVQAAPAPRQVTATPVRGRPAKADLTPSVATPTNGSASTEAPQLRAGERRMLQVLAQHYPVKVTRAQLGSLSKFTHTGGTFSAYFSTLKRNGLTKETDGEVQITPTGFEYLGADIPPRPQTTEELLELWRGALRAGERKMLDEL